MPPNPWRGEIAIMLDGREHILRPTFHALSAIEQELGTGLIALAKKLSQGALTLEEVACILVHTLEKPQSAASIKIALLQTGLTECFEAVAIMFVEIFSGFHESKE